MPRSVIYTENLAANSKSANLLSGDVNEFVPYDAVVTIYQVSSAIGIKTTAFADSDLLTDDKTIPYIGTTLDTSAHFMDQFEVAAGTRLAVFLREIAGVATTDIYTAVDISPA